jgi:hypothetical protein
MQNPINETTTFTITHTDRDQSTVTNITFDQVEKLYDGKGNNCRCGCGGEYYYPDDQYGRMEIESALARMQRSRSVESINNYIFEIVIRRYEEKERHEETGYSYKDQTKVLTIYLKK